MMSTSQAARIVTYKNVKKMLCTNHARSSFNKNEIHSSLWKLVFYMYTDSSYNTVLLKPIYIKYIKGR